MSRLSKGVNEKHLRFNLVVQKQSRWSHSDTISIEVFHSKKDFKVSAKFSRTKNLTCAQRTEGEIQRRRECVEEIKLKSQRAVKFSCATQFLLESRCESKSTKFKLNTDMLSNFMILSKGLYVT